MPLRDWVAAITPRGDSRVFDPLRYWEQRHRELAGNLAAVGHRNLTEVANAEQYQVKMSRIRSIIKRWSPPGERRTLLEAGCGSGVLTPRFLEMGFDVTAIDFSSKAVALARRKAPQARFKVESLCDFELKSRFDVIAVIDVLLHIVDESEWRSALTSLANHLSPDGTLILLDTLRESPNSAEHCRTRPLGAYQTALDALGLRIVEHVRFDLEHENSQKDLLAVRRLPSPFRPTEPRLTLIASDATPPTVRVIETHLGPSS